MVKRKFEWKSEKLKKIASVFALVLVVVAVGVANFALFNDESKEKEPAEQQTTTDMSDADVVDVFSAYRDERSQTRTQEISYIESVVSSAETDEKTKTAAQEQKLELVANMEAELTTEGLIKTKLLMDAIVTVKDGAVNVVVDCDTLTDEQVAQIAEIVKTQTGESAQNIKIMPQASAQTQAGAQASAMPQTSGDIQPSTSPQQSAGSAQPSPSQTK